MAERLWSLEFSARKPQPSPQTELHVCKCKDKFWEEVHETESRGYLSGRNGWGGSLTFQTTFFCVISIFILHGLKCLLKQYRNHLETGTFGDGHGPPQGDLGGGAARFNNGNKHCTKRGSTARNGITAALCFKGVGFKPPTESACLQGVISIILLTGENAWLHSEAQVPTTGWFLLK